MHTLVLYQSRGGHTREVAEVVAQTVRKLSHTVTIKSVIEVQKADIDQAEAVFVGTWVQGMILFGVKPAGAELWVPSLPALEGKPVGIFCTYAFNPRGSLEKLGDLLTQRGATIVGQHAFHRRHLHDGVEPFVRGVLLAAEHLKV